MMSATVTDAPCVERGKCYRLPVFQQLTGLKKHAMRTARHHGLKVHYVNGSAFVTGDDWFAYLDAMDGPVAGAE